MAFAVRWTSGSGPIRLTVKRVKGQQRFHANAKNGAWSLSLTIYPGDFKGYGKSYEIRFGADSPTDVDVGRRGSATFSNGFRRETYETDDGPFSLPAPGVVRFPKAGKRRALQIGLAAIWNGPRSDEAVAVSGRAPCR